MDKESTLKVILCWHMHQPDYRDFRSGQYQLPWTYLHVIKDYVDMVAHLENNRQARVVVNFAPVLLQQIDDYSQQVQRYFDQHKAINDPLLNALVEPTLSTNIEHRRSIVKACLRANEEHLVKRFSAYQNLYQLGEWLIKHSDDIRYLSDQYFVDLLMWYHLVWLGETVRTNNPRVKYLLEKGCGYTLHDRRELLSIIGELLSTVIFRYRRLSEQGQIELSFSPYAHPIIPLLLDTKCASQFTHNTVMPLMESYPGGDERAYWHLKHGVDIFEHFFLTKPNGCWLSEGGISEASFSLLDQFDFCWTASGESVLRNSLQKQSDKELAGKETFLYQPYQLSRHKVKCFFRDDELSDLIGFTYSDWHGDDAAANLLHRLEAVAEHPDTQPGSVVSIILDGENAWEYYPNNGYYFLNALYQSIANSSKLEFATFSDCCTELQSQQYDNSVMNNLVAGSWVYGTFSTWIGEPQKNRGWDMLADAKRCYDKVIASGQLNQEQLKKAEHQLAICESSDWFWWFGDYNPADTVSDFERLFRMHLANLYQCLNQEPPDYITEVFTHGTGSPRHGGVMRTGVMEHD